MQLSAEKLGWGTLSQFAAGADTSLAATVLINGRRKAAEQSRTGILFFLPRGFFVWKNVNLNKRSHTMLISSSKEILANLATISQ